MDPVSSLALVCNVAQLLQLGVSCGKSIHNIYKQGTSVQNERISVQAEQLTQLSSRVRSSISSPSSGQSTDIELQLIKIATETSQSAEKLSERLRGLTAQGSRRQRVKIAFQAWFKRSEIEELTNNLQKQQEILDSGILVVIWYISPNS